MSVSATMRIDVKFSEVDPWTSLGTDVLGAYGVTLKYGINGNGPVDNVASPGQLTFVLRNDARNSGTTQGWYSPAHASKRSGWGFGIPVRVVVTYSAVDYVKFIGKIREILPAAGRYREQVAYVTAYDHVRDLLDANAREVTVQASQTEAELIEHVLDSIPADLQPLSRDIDTGVDSYPFAFDDVGGGVKALALIKDVAVSALGLVFIKGDGTFCYRSRHTRALEASAYTFNDTMHGLSVPSTLDQVYTRVRATNHPKSVSASATDELTTLPSGNSIEIPSGESVEVWTDYTDPNDRTIKIGGTAVVTVLVGGTHYSAFQNADGSGLNLTGNIGATISPFSSTAKWTLTNTGGSTAYVTVLKAIGKAVRDLGPQTFEYVGGSTGVPLEIDLPYQDDPFIAESAATYIVSTYGSQTSQIDGIEFIANKSGDFMTQALTREIGDRITVIETATGISADAIIHSVSFDVSQPVHIRCSWGLAPASTFNFWQLGIAGASELGETTVLGF
jgi:hypothetical protein